ncbi:uncharacterized protein IL334_004183 [Kwoniella shivajii]|uniref:Vacuolar membrane protein n=1 Tax=Kwoniella shivajii TaxID=564305 RepID=A0ABZ1D0X0_9TREE|nr:hypothetical protein IL334_004183 [Kwoniella shivajii]
MLDWTMDYPSRVMIANVLGYLSIGSWLCAQLPQVIKNASLRSCEGLALPFLISWLFGDLTNLIGCLLTDQLPFQTYLAIYFCTIDCALVGQFIRYRKGTQNQIRPRISTSATSATPTSRYFTYNSLISSPHQSLILPPSTAPPIIRTRSTSGTAIITTNSSAPTTATITASGTTRPRPKRNYHSSNANPNLNYLQHNTSHNPHPPDINVQSPADGSYAAIYEAALDVARAAERASNRRRSASKKRRPSKHTSNSVIGISELIQNEDLTDSFHSEMSSSTIGEGETNNNYGGRSRLTQSTGTLLGDNRGRGRSMTRTRTKSPVLSGLNTTDNSFSSQDELDGLPTQGTLGLILGNAATTHQGQSDMREHKRSQSRSLSLVRGSGGRGGRRAAGVAFMSLGFLVGFGGFSSDVSGRTVGTNVGRVLSQPKGLQPNWNSLGDSSDFMSIYHIESSSNPHITEIPFIHNNQEKSPPHPPDEPPSFQRIIGRISAWACTTLYLASRLPQIWKNFQRKSVEGLSILLFVMAFFGNVTYVSSILLNPAGGGDPNEAGHYLLEALPYLLGSGGTLMFDLTIMIQSLIYGSSPPLPVPPTPMERSTRRRERGYFASRRKIRHLEDGSIGHRDHVRSHSNSHGHTYNHSQNSERAPLLPPVNLTIHTDPNLLPVTNNELDTNTNTNININNPESGLSMNGRQDDRSTSPEKQYRNRSRSKKRNTTRSSEDRSLSRS